MAPEFDNVKVRDQLGRPVDTTITVKRFKEDVIVEENASQYFTNTIGDSMILDHPINGVMDATNLGKGGTQITMDWNGRSGEVLTRVTNPNNIHREHFTTTTFKNSNTTADWADTAEELSFTNGEIAQSEEICYQEGTITSAKIIATLSSGDVSNLSFELTANGGSNWESVTHNTTHIFTNRSNNLNYKITASDTVVVSQIIVEYTREVS